MGISPSSMSFHTPPPTPKEIRFINNYVNINIESGCDTRKRDKNYSLM